MHTTPTEDEKREEEKQTQPKMINYRLFALSLFSLSLSLRCLLCCFEISITKREEKKTHSVLLSSKIISPLILLERAMPVSFYAFLYISFFMFFFPLQSLLSLSSYTSLDNCRVFDKFLGVRTLWSI